MKEETETLNNEVNQDDINPTSEDSAEGTEESQVITNEDGEQEPEEVDEDGELIDPELRQQLGWDDEEEPEVNTTLEGEAQHSDELSELLKNDEILADLISLKKANPQMSTGELINKLIPDNPTKLTDDDLFKNYLDQLKQQGRLTDDDIQEEIESFSEKSKTEKISYIDGLGLRTIEEKKYKDRISQIKGDMDTQNKLQQQAQQEWAESINQYVSGWEEKGWRGLKPTGERKTAINNALQKSNFIVLNNQTGKPDVKATMELLMFKTLGEERDKMILNLKSQQIKKDEKAKRVSPDINSPKSTGKTVSDNGYEDWVRKQHEQRLGGKPNNSQQQ